MLQARWRHFKYLSINEFVTNVVIVCLVDELPQVINVGCTFAEGPLSSRTFITV